ncbi:MAG: hypothetical protein AAGK14_09910 [Verrucomicrobiota bacterium]
MEQRQEAHPPSIYEFFTQQPENMIRVEARSDGEVHITLAVDNFSEQRKAYFVRELAAEGFIPDHYSFLSENELLGVKWHLGTEWCSVNEPPQPVGFHRGRMVVLACFAAWATFIAAMLFGLI